MSIEGVNSTFFQLFYLNVCYFLFKYLLIDVYGIALNLFLLLVLKFWFFFFCFCNDEFWISLIFVIP